MYFPNDEIKTGAKLVTFEVIELLRINKDQFKQISMISQGEFLNLLFASTEDRRKIFRKIFDTWFYEKLQDRLKAESSELKNGISAINSVISQQVENIKCDKESIYFTDLQKIRANPFFAVAQTLNLLDSIRADDIELRNKNDAALVQIEKDIIEAVEELNRIRRETEIKAEIELLRETLEKDNFEFEKAKEVYEAEKEGEGEIESLLSQIISLNEKLSFYEELDKISAELEKSRNNFKSLQDSTLKLKNEQVELNKKAEEFISKLELLGSPEINREKLINKLSMILEKQSKLKKLLEDIFQYVQTEIKHKKALIEYSAAYGEYENAKTTYDLKYKDFLDRQAGILASKLGEGKECPVCGSTEHPKLAVCESEALSEVQLDILKQKCEQLQKKANGISSLAGEFSGKLSGVRAEVEKGAEIVKTGIDIGKNFNISELKAKTEVEYNIGSTEITDTETKIKIEEEKIKSKSAVENMIKQTQSTVTENAEKINRNEIELERIRTIGKSLAEHKMSLRENLTHENKISAKAEIDMLSKTKTTKELAIKTAEATLSAYEKKVTEKAAKIQTLETQTLGIATENLDIILENKNTLEKEKFMIVQQKTQIYSKLSANEQIKENLISQQNKIEKQEKRYTYIKELSDTLNGTLSGKEKITLETYVQIEYFNKILKKANKRFLKMTGGKYEFIRHSEPDKGRSQTGLELDITDHSNGSLRSVKTLSGGESFMASLSLALGFSDEIKESAGGIRLDAMYIDEGFGSLDDTSLKSAIDTLYSLAEDNLLIGIISHVASLKEEIAKQIVVKKNSVGDSDIFIRDM